MTGVWLFGLLHALASVLVVVLLGLMAGMVVALGVLAALGLLWRKRGK